MFRATSAHHWEDQIVPTGTQDSRPLECIIPDDVLTQFNPPDDEHLLLKTWKGMK
jgi:hypothetical protein